MHTVIDGKPVAAVYDHGKVYLCPVLLVTVVTVFHKFIILGIGGD